ncbi:MAG: hypothetical protein WC247_06665 [Porticoccaceae bacterium]|jgi:hypothetical protein
MQRHNDTTAKSSSCLGKYLCSAGLLATLIFAGASHAAACDRPAFTSAIPDGRSASEEQMASAQQEISAFVKASEAYIQCIEGTSNAAKMRNDAIDDMEKVAAAFNRQLRTYRKHSQ